METPRQRAAEEARRKRQAEWDAFHAREQRAREQGKELTAADRRAAEILMNMRLQGGSRSRKSRSRKPQRTAAQRRASALKGVQTRRFNEAVRLGLL